LNSGKRKELDHGAIYSRDLDGRAETEPGQRFWPGVSPVSVSDPVFDPVFGRPFVKRFACAIGPLSVCLSGWRRGVVASVVRRMNEVTVHWARLVLGWVTVFGRVYHHGM